MPHHGRYVNALIAAGLFGISSALNKIVLKDMHPLVVAGLIYFSAGILLALIRFLPAFRKISERFKINIENKKLQGHDWFYLILVSLSGAVIAPFLFLYGLNLSTAVNASLLLNTEVLFTVVIAFLFLKERADKKEYLAILLLFVSAVAITTNLNLSSLSLTGSIFGNMFIVFGTFFWAVDNSLSKKLSIENDAVKVASLKSLIGGGTVLIMVLFLGIPLNLTLVQIPYILFVGFFSIGLSIAFFLSSLNLIGSMKTVVIFSTSSLFGAIFAFLILRDPISAIQIIAGAVMIYAIYLMSSKTTSPKDYN
jgi:drug/metabolite transporter (DMT)-like permease